MVFESFKLLFYCLHTTLKGWVTCAYTIYAQSFGQARVRYGTLSQDYFSMPTTCLTYFFYSPTNANLIYTFQPIFTALIAFLLLGETMGPAGVAGGSIIAGSVFVVATASFSEESISDSTSERRCLESDSSIVDVDGATTETNEEDFEAMNRTYDT